MSSVRRARRGGAKRGVTLTRPISSLIHMHVQRTMVGCANLLAWTFGADIFIIMTLAPNVAVVLTVKRPSLSYTSTNTPGLTGEAKRCSALFRGLRTINSTILTPVRRCSQFTPIHSSICTSDVAHGDDRLVSQTAASPPWR